MVDDVIAEKIATEKMSVSKPNRRNSGTKSQVSINQIRNSTFDFEESISIIKTKGWRLQSRENCEKITEYKKPPRGKTNKFLLSLFFRGHFRDFLPFYSDVTIIHMIIKKISSNEHSSNTYPNGAPHSIWNQTPKPP